MTDTGTSPTPSPSPPIDVCHYVAGGAEHGGGIGRLVGYVMAAQPPGAAGRHRLRDTRGPCWRPLGSGLRLAAAAAGLLAARVTAPGRLHHLHVAGRGSTARKLLLCALARRLGSRHLLHLHDYDYAADFARRPPWQQAAVRAMFRGAEAVIVLGERDRATAIAVLGVRPDRVHVLRNCVPDPGPPPQAARGEAGPGLPPRPVTLLFLGRLEARKGVPELIEALASPRMAACAAAPGWRAVLSGDGPVAALRDEAERLGLGERVRFTGWLDAAEVRRLCAAADILVLPSRAEGMAMAVLEGLSHGLAVVTTRVGAHDEVLRDGETCAFVPVGDAGALADRLSRLVADAQERRRLGRAGRALFEREFGITAYAERLRCLHAGLARPPARVPRAPARDAA
ncbi:glycosyltransferase family 4 protein [Oceanicella sp. SM1341]|uniref:glycosyltransferase family 4 protein n=1 Tax=Oceanicella sp. SM1341 TaxID=1548889 RepID=UPI000E4D8E9A|nr:glycosyltransferase family 4 protein [Oceanicella sp. SM1341]